ncbi:hypothetical protein HMN09_01182500 [Mycena chlorophos]|uniref:CsbD-like domain-containing protein n=1 Tax=Mycena chlorophos TaxID=658473 RepID=A0A8H6VTZ4_MYCCL|nr:hypothetical protein HMN09_01182500 [Mycena chlorophos]
MASTNDLSNTSSPSSPSQSTSTEPSKAWGTFHSTKGTVVEMIGHMTGATSWQQTGRNEHMRGEAEVQAAEAKAYVDGTIDRAQGKIDSVMGAVLGDTERQVAGNLRHDAGKAAQEANKPV